MKLRNIFEEYDSDGFIVDYKGVVEWIRLNINHKIDLTDIHVHDGKVDVVGDIFLKNRTKTIGVRFATVGAFDGPNLESWEGLPTSCDSLDVASDTLDNLDGFPHGEYGEVRLAMCLKIKSLKGIEKRFKHCEKLTIPKNTERDILGLILVPGLTKVDVWGSGMATPSEELVFAVDIINKHLGKGNPGVVKAHRELMDADLDEFANK